MILKFSQEAQVAMEIRVKNFQLVILLFYTQNNHNKDLEIKFNYENKFILLFHRYIKF